MRYEKNSRFSSKIVQLLLQQFIRHRAVFGFAIHPDHGLLRLHAGGISLKSPGIICRSRVGLRRINLLRLASILRTVVRKHKFFRERYLHKIFSEGLVDFVSTDSHDLPGRSNKLKAACEKLTEEYGEDLARALTHDNAERILLESSR